jgi:ATP-dependent DNA helicase RecQ
MAAIVSIHSFRGGTGKSNTAANLAAVLAGKQTSWVRRQPWVLELSHFGALAWPEERLRLLISEMLEAGLMRQAPGEYPVLQLTSLGARAARGQVDLSLSLPAAAGPTARRSPALADATPPPHPALVESLKRWRLERAREDGVPPYVVFHDRTLLEIAGRAPDTLEALAQVPGVGPAKLDRYGSRVLELVKELR